MTTIQDLLGEVYSDRERLSRGEIHRRAAQLHPSPVLDTLLDAMPVGHYDRYQAGVVLAQIQAEEGLWRDERRTDLADLRNAMAESASDGQYDDQTGNEARTEADGDNHRNGLRRPGPEPPLGPN